jgi:DNA-directed RNA polymerase subunit K/omega
MSPSPTSRAKGYDPLNPSMSRWDKEAAVCECFEPLFERGQSLIGSLAIDTPPTDSTLRAAYRAKELAEEGERLERSEKRPYYTAIGGVEISRRPKGSAAVAREPERPKESGGQGDRASEFWYLPATTRAAAYRARELENEARKADMKKTKSSRFTWIGGCEFPDDLRLSCSRELTRSFQCLRGLKAMLLYPSMPRRPGEWGSRPPSELCGRIL